MTIDNRNYRALLAPFLRDTRYKAKCLSSRLVLGNYWRVIVNEALIRTSTS